MLPEEGFNTEKPVTSIHQNDDLSDAAARVRAGGNAVEIVLSDVNSPERTQELIKTVGRNSTYSTTDVTIRWEDGANDFLEVENVRAMFSGLAKSDAKGIESLTIDTAHVYTPGKNSQQNIMAEVQEFAGAGGPLSDTKRLAVNDHALVRDEPGTEQWREAPPKATVPKYVTSHQAEMLPKLR